MSFDIVYLAFNRVEFTRASLDALLQHTCWGAVSRMIIYDDGSTDGALDLAARWINRHDYLTNMELRRTRLGNPVAVMRDYLENAAELFVKIDSDTILPPDWDKACLSVMQKHEELDLLGIEPPASRTRPPWSNGKPLVNPEELRDGPLRYVRCNSIGGIGMMRRRAFEDRPLLNPHGTYGGFTDWQIRHQPGLVCGWIAPPLNAFLLDRMPIEPWASLSRQYIDAGWQRPWRNYDVKDSGLWGWWT